MRGRNPTAREILLSGEAAGPDAKAAASFFRGLRLRNGTCKTTWEHRLLDLDALVLRHLPPPGPLRILDAGASTGVTTLDWVVSLTKAGYRPRAAMIDISVRAFLLRKAGMDLLLDRSGTILHFSLGEWSVFRPDPVSPRVRSRVGRGLFGFLEYFLVRKGGFPQEGAIPVDLVAPAVSRHEHIEVVECDLRHPIAGWQGTFDVVRAANVLNAAYFDAPTISLMLTNLFGMLRSGGLLILCRTDAEGSTAASIIRLSPTGDATVVDRLAAGSEVEQLALQL